MPSRHEAKLQEAKSRPIDLVMIGDSITHNWESERNYEQTFAGENLLNLGFAGDRTQNVLWRIQNGALDGISPKLVTLLIGANHFHDARAKTGYTPDSAVDVFRGIQKIVEEIRRILTTEEESLVTGRCSAVQVAATGYCAPNWRVVGGLPPALERGPAAQALLRTVFHVHEAADLTLE